VPANRSPLAGSLDRTRTATDAVGAAAAVAEARAAASGGKEGASRCRPGETGGDRDEEDPGGPRGGGCVRTEDAGDSAAGMSGVAGRLGWMPRRIRIRFRWGRWAQRDAMQTGGWDRSLALWNGGAGGAARGKRTPLGNWAPGTRGGCSIPV
jgi:hypothetical protein